jgi:hypothetical protein
MKKPLVCVLGAAAVIGMGLTSTAAFAAVAAPGHPDSTVTFEVGTGLLSMTAPDSATLATGTGQPGTTISGLVGTTVVTDDRASLAATWTVSISTSDFTTGTLTTAETIPADDVTYTAGSFFTTGTITATATPATLTLSTTAAEDIFGTAGVGDNSATWNPTLHVAIPSAAVTGGYTGTLTQSVL